MINHSVTLEPHLIASARFFLFNLSVFANENLKSLFGSLNVLSFLHGLNSPGLTQHLDIQLSEQPIRWEITLLSSSLRHRGLGS